MDKINSIFTAIEFSDCNYFIPADEYLIQFAKQRNAKLKKEFELRLTANKNKEFSRKNNLTNRSS